MGDAGHNTNSDKSLLKGFCLTDLSTTSLVGASVTLSAILWIALAAMV